MKIRTINEFFNSDTPYEIITEEEMDYLISIPGSYMNIYPEIFIFIGHNPHSAFKRIKVSPNKKFREKVFTIDIDQLVVLGDYDKSVITNKTIDNIFRWIKINRDILEELSKEDFDVILIKKLTKIT